MESIRILPYDHDFAEHHTYFPELLIDIPKKLTYSYFLNQTLLSSKNISWLRYGETQWLSHFDNIGAKAGVLALEYFSTQPVYQSTFFKDVIEYVNENR